MNHSFPPFFDPRRFPLLTYCVDTPYALACADAVAFYGLDNPDLLRSITRADQGEQWSRYGDVRWPDAAVWTEFLGYYSNSPQGILTVRADLAATGIQGEDLIDRISAANPLRQLVPWMRDPAAAKEMEDLYFERWQLIESQGLAEAASHRPAHVQGYIFCEAQAVPGKSRQYRVAEVAAYFDLLNAAGEVIIDYRFANAARSQVPLAQFGLHALFCLNRARREGTPFQRTPQLARFAPAPLEGDAAPPSWVGFHPTRTLRKRPGMRAAEAVDGVRLGAVSLQDAQRAVESRRGEVNKELSTFERAARPAENLMAMIQTDVNAGMVAFTHRAHGGAIYVLPERLVEEFYQTECGEVCVGDVKLPFANLYLKFAPPEPLWLADGARVDGCYLARQGDEHQGEHLLLMLTSRLEGVDYVRSASCACVDQTCGVRLPIGNGETTVAQAVEAGVAEFLADNAPPTDDWSGPVRAEGVPPGINLRDGRPESRRRRIAAFRQQEPALRACLNIVINAACFIGFYPESVIEEWAGPVPPAEVVAAAEAIGKSRGARDRRAGALQKLAQGDYTRIRVCGRSLFDEAPEREMGADADGTGRSPRAHWRRGHWRRQKHGTGYALVALRWIRPVIVKRESGTPVEARIYEVADPAVPATES